MPDLYADLRELDHVDADIILVGSTAQYARMARRRRSPASRGLLILRVCVAGDVG